MTKGGSGDLTSDTTSTVSDTYANLYTLYLLGRVQELLRGVPDSSAEGVYGK